MFTESCRECRSGNSDIALAVCGYFNRTYAYIKKLKELQEPGSKAHIPRLLIGRTSCEYEPLWIGQNSERGSPSDKVKFCGEILELAE